MADSTIGPGVDESVDRPDPEDLPLPPGPDGLPLIGNTHQLLRDPFGYYDRLAEHGDVVASEVGFRSGVTLFHPEQIQRVLVEDADRYVKGSLIQDTGGSFAPNGLVFTEGEQWRGDRMAIQPVFQPDRIRGYADTMARYAREHVAEWDDGQRIDLQDELTDLTLAILCKSLLDLDVRDQRGAIDRAADELLAYTDVDNYWRYLPEWMPTPADRRLDRAMDEFHGVVDELIDQRRGAPEEYDDLLATLLTAERPDGSRMDDETVRDQMVTFLFAGHETSSLVLTYALYLLATHPEKRQRLREELDEVVGDEAPALKHLPGLEYTERVLDEAMRLYPPAYVLFREPVEDVALGGYRVPEGWTLVLPTFRAHRDPRFYDDPDAFRPERWAGGLDEELPDYAFFPFGGGPRHCIGMRFARMELQLVLATIEQRVTITFEGEAPGLDPKMSATLQPGVDLEPTVRKRE